MRLAQLSVDEACLDFIVSTYLHMMKGNMLHMSPMV